MLNKRKCPIRQWHYEGETAAFLKVSLEDLYCGTSKKLSLTRNVIFFKCTVETISNKYRCPRCKGHKVFEEKKILEVHVEKGMRNGQRITFPGEANKASNTVSGVLVFILTLTNHPKFERQGDNLFVEHTLSPTEALFGFQFVLTHLDGRKLLIKSNPGQVVEPDSYKAVNDEGMPMYQKPFMNGKLYIHFSVAFAGSFMTMEQWKAWQGVPPARTSSQLIDIKLDECEETTLLDVNLAEELRKKRAQYDEDHDVHGGGVRVECAQQ